MWKISYREKRFQFMAELDPFTGKWKDSAFGASGLGSG